MAGIAPWIDNNTFDDTLEAYYKGRRIGLEQERLRQAKTEGQLRREFSDWELKQRLNVEMQRVQEQMASKELDRQLRDEISRLTDKQKRDIAAGSEAGKDTRAANHIGFLRDQLDSVNAFKKRSADNAENRTKIVDAASKVAQAHMEAQNQHWRNLEGKGPTVLLDPTGNLQAIKGTMDMPEIQRRMAQGTNAVPGGSSLTDPSHIKLEDYLKSPALNPIDTPANQDVPGSPAEPLSLPESTAPSPLSPPHDETPDNEDLYPSGASAAPAIAAGATNAPVNEVIRRLKNGQRAVYNADTKEFLRYAD